jgi:hypothetical protein
MQEKQLVTVLDRAPGEPPVGQEDRDADELLAELVRTSQIRVNGRSREIDGNVATYEQIVKFAFPAGPGKPNTRFTITYRNAAQVPAMGELDPGQKVKVKPGRKPENETIFNVTETVLS